MLSSIVVPTRNRPNSLRRCIRALRALAHPPGEVIVVVDGGDVELAKRQATLTGGPPIKLIVNPESIGPAAARNRGAAQAKFPILAFVDDDCVVDPGWLGAIEEGCKSNPGALVGGKTVNGLDSNPFAESSQLLLDYLDTVDGVPTFFTSNNMACYRDRFLEIGGFDDSFPLPAGEDRDLCERWQARGELVREPTAVVVHNHSMDLGEFLKQHYRYGKGAWTLSQRRRLRDESSVAPKVSFYRGLVRFFKDNAPSSHSKFMLVALAITSQLAHAAGIGRQALSK